MIGKTRLEFESILKPDTVAYHQTGSNALLNDAPHIGAPQKPDVNDSNDPNDPIATPILPPNTKLIFDWGSGIWTQRLNRAVTIVGEDHPSVIRLHGSRLRQCDHAIICFDEQVWFIEIHPDRIKPEAPLVKRLRVRPKSYFISGIHFWVANHDENRAKLIRSDLVNDSSESILTTKLDDTSGSRAKSRQSNVRSKNQRSGQPRNLPVDTPVGTATRTSASSNANPDSAEQQTIELTERFLKTNSQRGERQRMLKLIGSFVVAIITFGIVVALVVRGVLPLVRSIYQV